MFNFLPVFKITNKAFVRSIFTGKMLYTTSIELRHWTMRSLLQAGQFGVQDPLAYGENELSGFDSHRLINK